MTPHKQSKPIQMPHGNLSLRLETAPRPRKYRTYIEHSPLSITRMKTTFQKVSLNFTSCLLAGCRVRRLQPQLLLRGGGKSNRRRPAPVPTAEQNRGFWRECGR